MAEYGLVTPGGAVWWWLFWFVTSLLLYCILGFWFLRHGRREDREQSAADAGPGVDGDAGAGPDARDG